MQDFEIFMIHCRRLADRLDFQKKQFSNIGLEFQIIDCVKINKVGNFANKAIKSLFLSHFKCIKKAIKTNKYVLVLEDDAKIINKEELLNYIQAAREIEDEWDMLYFYQNTDKKSIEEKNYYFNKVKFNGMSHAYIINPKKLLFFYEEIKNFYKKIEKGQKKLLVECHIDRFFINNIHPKIKVISTKKELISQASNIFGSTLGWGRNGSEVLYEYD